MRRNCLFAAIVILFYSCGNKSTLFQVVSPGYSGIHFANNITENDSMNMLDYEYLYNGAGVGIGDFNRDGKPDIYFAGNMVSNRLYLNKGNMKFTDITESSGTGGEGKWCNGVAVVDINNDGWPDIFVSTSYSSNPEKRKKILYINQGLNNNGIPTFKDEAAAYGLDDTCYSTMAAFFDYDNDGDLDMFLLVANKQQTKNRAAGGMSVAGDTSLNNISRLYRNDWDSARHHAIFTNVTGAAGINKAGYGLGVNITDINKDGWKDILVSNDYVSRDLLWINNHDGTFTDKSAEYFKHTSFSAMGNDVEDINNDGLCDIIELDMNAADNYRKKMMTGPVNNNLNTPGNNKQRQYGRNTLQLNLGDVPDDSIAGPAFGDISYMAGVAATDWSWSPLVADFDNDGYRDIVVTNGLPKDISDHDFLAYRDKLGTIAPQEMIAAKLPEAKLKNYAFHNNGDITFGNVSASWGLNFPSFSNGAAYADLDGDGDVDIIINNINGEATILKNTLEESKPQGANYLDIQFADRDKESAGQGAWVALYYAGGKQQVYENTPYRGYLSSTQPGAHFGLGSVNMVDTVIIKWPGGRQQLLHNVKCNQKIKVQYANANQSYTWYGKSPKSKLFESLPAQAGTIIHSEDMFNDFAIQKLLPHKLSDYAPGLAAGDVNGDGLDDIIMGGSPGHSAEILQQQLGGNFIEKKLLPNAAKTNKQQDDTGLLLFDADSDGDMDLYIASGGCSSIANNPAYNDRLFINDGKGNFVYDSLALPVNNASKACVRAVDFDKDGDLDLFVAGRAVPGKYPQPASCFIYRNDSKNRNALFTDITSQAAAGLKDAGMVTDAVWTDFDNDGWVDLVIAGEFMPVEFFKNINGKLQKISTGLDSQTGWWNSIIPGDFDNDGDIDYIIGNTGTNTLYTRASEYPVKIYAKDFDNNGIVDGIITMYSPSSTEDTTVREFPVPARDELTRQVADFRKRFPTYKSYATATIDSLFTPAQFKGVQKLVANNFKSCYVRNDGGGKFTIMPLPIQAQMSALFGMLAEDVNGDGNLDVIINSNDFGTDLNTGQADAMNGLVLLGDGNGKFTAISAAQSGVFIPGSGRALVKIADKNGHCIVAASQNNGPLKFFIQNNAVTTLRVNAADEVALEKLKNGKTRRVEINYGAGFLSQSARFLNISSQVISVEIIDNRGRKRKVL